jgi:hypothetical protein
VLPEALLRGPSMRRTASLENKLPQEEEQHSRRPGAKEITIGNEDAKAEVSR